MSAMLPPPLLLAVNEKGGKKGFARAIEQFKHNAELLGEGTLPENVEDSTIYTTAFSREKLLDLVSASTAFMVADDMSENGRVGTKIKAGVLYDRCYCLCFYACRELREAAGDLYPTWKLTLDSLCDKVIKENNLCTDTRPKNFFGMPELQLLFNIIIQRSESTAWMKQQFLAWAIAFATGSRPSSLGAL
ncbi:MAG: hypothetical protein MMC33_004106 [Icmadophila ericetorum]|nr:hypothetical protein [Icmadophila ericetorum]